VLGEPLLGIVAAESRGLLADADLLAPRGRQCLALRSELLLLRSPQSRPTIMFTSAFHSPARSRLSADLGRIFARSGLRVLLVDASMADDGLSALHGMTGDSIRALLRDPGQPIAKLQHPTDLADLAVLTGRTSTQDAHLLPTLHWPRAVAAIEHAAELAIFDGPPILDGADAPLLAPSMGGVVLVIDPRGEQCSDTRRAVERLRAVEAPLLGVVVLSYAPRSLRELVGRLLPSRKAAKFGAALADDHA
jgi:Mrp family chromosome partitioning ATPase